jgi:phosphatidate cytidylyltransferase
VAVLVAALFRRRNAPLPDTAATLFGVAYPAFLLGSVVVLREAQAPWLVDDDAFWLTATVLFGIWGADTLAYFAGRAFGRHPLLPAVSPKKTWEGFAGGVAGAVALTAAFKLVALPDVLTWLDVAAIAAACGVAGPLGDLAESAFKRSVGAKDSATWLPGHGGMLDRLDAALVAVPLVVAYLSLVKGFA